MRPSFPARRLRALATATAAVALLVAVPGPALAVPGNAPLIDGWRPAPAPRAVIQVSIVALEAPGAPRTARRHLGTSPAGGNPCTDRARRLMNEGWQGTFTWSFRASSTPPNLSRRATARVLERAASNITGANNDCGREDRVSATHVFLGASDHRPAPRADLQCRPKDGHSVVGFGRIPSHLAGLTCVFTENDKIVEVDIKLNSRSDWALSLATCSFETMLEAVATHEFGHAFGLDHVSESTHGRLTMSTRLDGYCQNAESTLGAGDIRGLEEIY